ncbi:MAG: 30S ribosomal protein S5 [Patescibacteria group bacterium UBA2163]
MTEEKKTQQNNEEVKTASSKQTSQTDDKNAPAGKGKGDTRPARGGARGGGDRRGGGRRGGRGRGDDRARSEFDQKVISLRRVSRVVAGGRRFSFSAAVVAGDRKGRVGVGVGKGVDTALAMDKAFRDAKRNMVRVPLTDTKSIPHDVKTKYSASMLELRPSPARGIVAGSSVRTVLELAGVTDVIAKLYSRSKNKINNARATVQALMELSK